jgi:hypothetical protein
LWQKSGEAGKGLDRILGYANNEIAFVSPFQIELIAAHLIVLKIRLNYPNLVLSTHLRGFWTHGF